MKTIEISTELFARIWSLRKAGEETENEILERILGQLSIAHEEARNMSMALTAVQSEKRSSIVGRKVRWLDDVSHALGQLGRRAHLTEIYDEVAKIRKVAGRTLPKSTQAIIRRTLEENSKDSDSFKGEDIFHMTDHKGAGFWSLRSH